MKIEINEHLTWSRSPSEAVKLPEDAWGFPTAIRYYRQPTKDGHPRLRTLPVEEWANCFAWDVMCLRLIGVNAEWRATGQQEATLFAGDRAIQIIVPEDPVEGLDLLEKAGALIGRYDLVDRA